MTENKQTNNEAERFERDRESYKNFKPTLSELKLDEKALFVSDGKRALLPVLVRSSSVTYD